jgi:hypothetical protein
MKITKFVDVNNIEVECDVSVAEMMDAIFEGDDSQFYLKRTIANIHSFLKNIPDKEIELMEVETKKIVFEKFTEQIQRFKP